jgi:hypothetical protein
LLQAPQVARTKTLVLLPTGKGLLGCTHSPDHFRYRGFIFCLLKSIPETFFS